MCEEKTVSSNEIKKFEISSRKLRDNLSFLLRRDILECNSKELTGLLKNNSKLYGYETMEMNEVAFDKKQRISTFKSKTRENRCIFPGMGSEKEKTENFREVMSKNSAISERNGSRKLQRKAVKKHLLKYDTLNNTFDADENSSYLHNTAANTSSRVSKFSLEDTNTGNFLQIQERKLHFCDGCTNSCSRFVVKALPSDRACSLMNGKMEKRQTQEEAFGSKIVDKITPNDFRNSPEMTDSGNEKQEDLISRFVNDDNVLRRCVRDSTGSLDPIRNVEGEEIPSLKKRSVYLTELTSHADENEELFYREKYFSEEYKDIFADNGKQEKEFKPTNLENFVCLEISDDHDESKKKDVSLDIKTILNYTPRCLFSARDLESKRAISKPVMKVCKRPTALATREKAFQSPSRKSQEYESKKPVSLLPKPVKPVRLKMKHRQDEFMNHREGNNELNQEEGRILPTTLSACKDNCYSVMTPYMAKVVWSVLEHELTD